MAEVPPQNLLQMWAVVGELRAQVREQAEMIHRLSNLVQALQTDADRRKLLESTRDCPRVLHPQTPG